MTGYTIDDEIDSRIEFNDFYFRLVHEGVLDDDPARFSDNPSSFHRGIEKSFAEMKFGA